MIVYSEEDLLLLDSEGWKFNGEDYIYIPDDEDGCMADGEKNIRYVIKTIRDRLSESRDKNDS